MASRSRVLLAVLLPLAAILAGVVSAERRASRAPHLVFEIEGYDPRDLLRGRYLQFRLRLPAPPADACGDSDPDCCLCATEGEPGGTARVAYVSCAAEPDCDAILPAARAGMPLRFYVPEARAPQVERELLAAAARGAARADVAIAADGTIQVRGLRLDAADEGDGVPVP